MVNKSPSGNLEAEGKGRLPESRPTMEPAKKKVERRSTNSSEEHEILPEDRSPMWDNESGHLLSYFLSDHSNQGNGIPSPPAQFPSTISSQTMAAAAAARYSQPMQGLFHHPSSNPEDFDDDPVPPPTPAVQFYHHSKPKEISLPQRGKKSNNPLLKMKVSFASDIANSGEKIAQQIEAMSPISPTGMIGPLQEQLMLPPPSNNPSDRNQSHLSWLQHINAMAKAALKPAPPPQHPYSITSIAPPPGVAMPQPISYSNDIATMQPTTSPSPIFYAQVARLNSQLAAGGESEEKRARRLERNREAARKSRRRKKERLSHLEKKVANLYHQIETERRKEINSMDDALAENLKQKMAIFRSASDEKFEHETRERLSYLIQSTGPNCEVRRAVIEYQYSALKQTILPRYQKFLLWLTLHSEEYFTTGKEMYHSCQEGKEMLRVPPGKISSKQVGEDLTNKMDDSSENGEKPNQTAGAFDKARMWPLVCFELSISVDQEEKLMNAHKKLRQLQMIEERRSQISAATKMAANLKEAMLYQSHNAAMRSKHSLIGIMTPQQTMKYQEWLASNKRRCKEKLLSRKEASGRASPNSLESASLLEVCKRLEQVVISQEAKRTEK